MKILSLHCDYIKFRPLKKALRQPGELSEEARELSEVKEPLVILTAIEKQDETNPNLIQQLSEEIRDIAKQVNAKHVVLYPYAHLSSSLSNPNFAQRTLEDTHKELEKTHKVSRAPFGYYKEFELKCKGHPLSELSREITHESEGKLKPQETVGVLGKDIDHKQLLREVSKSKLDNRKLKPNDHRILGQQMNLFSFSETAPGMVFWHNDGLIIRNLLIDFWREEHRKAGYQEISTPQILDKKLWQISGHWDLYKENMFTTDYEKKQFAVKPMNCPGGMLIYKNKPRSYKDLPLKIAELGMVHRLELSGVLAGLFRAIQFTQDDAHVFCTEEQLEDEIIKIIKLINIIIGKFGFKYKYTLSTRSSDKKEKYMGGDEIWNAAEETIKKAMKKLKLKLTETPGEAKFYGPSLDIQVKDSLGREWQCSTIQLDMQLSERFGLTYTDKDNKEKTPLMLHRVVYGSLERFIGVILEHTNGHLPLWLAPKQVRIINFTDRNNKTCKKLEKELTDLGFRTDLDLGSEPLPGKIKQAEIEKIPYILVIGGKEEKSKSVAVRHKGRVRQQKIKDFLKKIQEEVEKKK